MKCFQCQSPVEKFDLPCSVCGWAEPGHIEEEDDRYLVFMNLVNRVEVPKTHERGYGFYSYDAVRLDPTPREFAMFQHGEQCRVDEVCWRITARNVETGGIFVRGWRAGLSDRGELVTAGVQENLKEKIEKRNEEDRLREEEELSIQEALRDARQIGNFDLDLVPFMTEEDWESLSPEQAQALTDRYETTME